MFCDHVEWDNNTCSHDQDVFVSCGMCSEHYFVQFKVKVTSDIAIRSVCYHAVSMNLNWFYVPVWVIHNTCTVIIKFINTCRSHI